MPDDCQHTPQLLMTLIRPASHTPTERDGVLCYAVLCMMLWDLDKLVANTRLFMTLPIPRGLFILWSCSICMQGMVQGHHLYRCEVLCPA